MIPDAIMNHGGLSPTAKLVYGYLARCAGRNGECFPSMGKIAAAVAISPRQATRAVRELQGAELLKQFARVDRNGQHSNAYQFLWQDFLSASYPAPPDRYDTPGVSDMSPRREQVKERSTEEHVLERLPLSAMHSPAELSQLSSLLHVRSGFEHPPTEGQINTIFTRAAACAGRPVSASEVIAIARSISVPRGRAKAIQSYTWWASAIGNQLAEARSAAYNFRPEDFTPSPDGYEPTTEAADLMETLMPVGRVN